MKELTNSHANFSSQLQLRDQAERLFTKVGYLESRLGHLSTSSTDVSHRLVQSEEEKLKVGLVNMRRRFVVLSVEMRISLLSSSHLRFPRSLWRRNFRQIS